MALTPLRLSEQKSDSLLANHLPWNYISGFHEGVVIQKEGLLQRSFVFRAPDLEASAAVYVNDLAQHLSDSIKRLGSGWAVQFEVQRFSTCDYPGAQFDILAGYLIDKERELAFRSYGRHYESSYYLTFTYKPPLKLTKKLINFFYTDTGYENSLKENIAFFVQQTNDVVGILSSRLLIAPLDNGQTLNYLHSSVSRNWHTIDFPDDPMFLDRILPDQSLDTGLTMMLGEEYIPIVAVSDFPRETHPAIFDNLNKAEIEYRWVTRYICLDKEEGLKTVDKAGKAHRGNQVSWLQSFLNATSKDPRPKKINEGSVIKETDASQAQIEIDTDEVSLGLYSSNIMVWDKELEMAKGKAAVIKKIIQSTGFTCKEETINAFEAWKSMMPGQVYANHRKLPIVSSTFSHIVPLSSIWAGMVKNAFAGEITGIDLPHLVCSTDYGTPFFFNLNLFDVGHATVWGPTGSGKSTFLNLLEMQFLKYPGAQIIVLDKGKSARQSTLAAGGKYYEPGSGRISFQPLGELETEADCVWATEFIETLLHIQNIPITPQMSTAIHKAIQLMKELPKQQRTLTTFQQLVSYQDPQTGQPVIHQSLSPYLLGGKYGNIFDAADTSINLNTRWLTLEMEHLMNMGEACVAPALSYIFYFIEKKFTGQLTLLVLDEAWLFLKHPIFQRKIEEWLKVLRKKRVFVVFATQDISDAVKSPLCSTLLQQCPTKIFLPDPEAETPALAANYRLFGLTDAEINAIRRSQGKRDYFYKSTFGSRLFRLDLGAITKALITEPDHTFLDELEARHIHQDSYEYCMEILDHKKVDYSALMPKKKTA